MEDGKSSSEQHSARIFAQTKTNPSYETVVAASRRLPLGSPRNISGPRLPPSPRLGGLNRRKGRASPSPEMPTRTTPKKEATRPLSFRNFHQAIDARSPVPVKGAVDPSGGGSRAKLQAETRTEQSSRRPGMSIDQRFSAMVRAPSPRPLLSIPPKRSNTRETSAGSSVSSEAAVGSVRSFTVNTEAGGKKNLSETEISHLVRSSIQKARRNAKNKGRKSQDQLSIQASQVLVVGSPAAGASPAEAAAAAAAGVSPVAAADTLSHAQRKFSWSSVEEESDSEDDNKELCPDQSLRKSSTAPEQHPLPRAWPHGGFFRGLSGRVAGETGDERTGPLDGAKVDDQSRREKGEASVIGEPAKDDCEKLKETENNSEEQSRRSSLQNSISRAKMARDEITELLHDEQVEAVISTCASDIRSAMSGLSVNSADKDSGVNLHSSLEQSKVGNNGRQLDDEECVEGMSSMPIMSQSNVNNIVADTMRRAKEAAKNNPEETKIPATKTGTESTAESPKSLSTTLDDPTTDESKDKAATPEFKNERNLETPRSPKSAEILQTAKESMNHQPSVKSPLLSPQEQERPLPDVTEEPVSSPRTPKSPKSPPAHLVEASPESADTTTKVATESALAEGVGSTATGTKRKTVEPNTIASPRASKSRAKLFASLSIEIKESLANVDELSLASSSLSPVKSSTQAADSESKRISRPVDLDFTKRFSSAMTRAQARRLSAFQQKEELVEPAAPLSGAELSIDPAEKVTNDNTSPRLAGAADVTIAVGAGAGESPNDKWSADESIDALDDAVAGESEKLQPSDKSRADESINALGDDVAGEADASLPKDKSGKTRLGILQNTLGETQGDSAEYGLEVALVSTSETSSSSENSVGSPESSTKEEESADQKESSPVAQDLVPDSSIPGEDAPSHEIVLSEKGQDAVESTTKEATFEFQETKKTIAEIPESAPDGKEMETTAPTPLTSDVTHEGTKKGEPSFPKIALLHASPRGSGESLPTSPTSNVSAALEKSNAREPTPKAKEVTETIGSQDISAASQNGAGRQLLTLKESPSSDDEFVGKTVVSPLVPSDSTSHQAGKYSKLRAKKKKKRVKRRSRESREDRSLLTPNPGETVIQVTEEFLAEIASRKGSTLTAEELNRLLNAATPAKNLSAASEATKKSLMADEESVASAPCNDDHVAEDDRAVSPIVSTPQSRESRTSRASSRKSRESRTTRASSITRSRASTRTHMTKSHHAAPFCMDFLWQFGFHDDIDADLLEDDSISFSQSGSLDDYGSDDYNDDTTIGEATVDNDTVENSTNYGTGASNSFESRGRGGSPFNAESPQTLTQLERRRVTFSFSEGRCTSDYYDGSSSDSSTQKNW